TIVFNKGFPFVNYFSKRSQKYKILIPNRHIHKTIMIHSKGAQKSLTSLGIVKGKEQDIFFAFGRDRILDSKYLKLSNSKLQQLQHQPLDGSSLFLERMPLDVLSLIFGHLAIIDVYKLFLLNSRFYFMLSNPKHVLWKGMCIQKWRDQILHLDRYD